MPRSAKTSFFFFFLAIILFVACSGSAPSVDAPAQAARDWYVAVNTMETLEADGLVCQSKREEFRRDMEVGSTFLIFGQLLLGGNVDIELDASEVEFVTVEKEDGRAFVKVKGEMRAAVGGSITSETLNEHWIMVQEDGKWKWCGTSESDTLPPDYDRILTQAAQDFVHGVLNDSADVVNSYYEVQGSHPQGEPADLNHPRWGKGTIYSPLDTDELKKCFEKIPLDDISFKANQENWDVWIADRGTESPTFIIADGSEATIGFAVRGSIPNSDFYLIHIFVSGCVQDEPPPGDMSGIESKDTYGRILFVSLWEEEEKSWLSEIYGINDDGSDLKKLSDNQDTMNYDLRFSPDGEFIVFVSARGESNGRLYLMNSDGSNLRDITPNEIGSSGFINWPNWSPDGNRIAALVSPSGNIAEDLGVYMMNPDGTAFSQVFILQTLDSFDWSPSGQDFVYSFTVPSHPFPINIGTVSLEGVSAQLTDHPDSDFIPKWSPDGQRIAFYSDRDGNKEIYVMKADGSDLTNLTNHPANDLSPVWSPDGKKILFSSDRDTGDYLDSTSLYIMDVDGNNVTPLNGTSLKMVVPYDWALP